ncbi:MAG: serine hydrolase [Flavobacteriales bacterium]|nr:serine hydrolase [Flavobacteriales bacterium]
MTKPDIDDFRFSDTRPIAIAKEKKRAWNKPPDAFISSLSSESLSYHEAFGSTAFLVTVGNDILFEQYWEDYDSTTISNSFSMAKSFTAMCVMRAQEEGLLDIDDHVCKYLPRFCDGKNADLTIKHLLLMTSNINFGESYSNPFGYQAKAYFNDDLFGLTAPYQVETKAGSIWKYQGGDTVILHEILEKATGKTLAGFFSEKFWQKMGAENEAYWGLDDENGKEKAFSAVYATARDFAKVGQLFRDEGRLSDGNQALTSESISSMIQPVGIPDSEGSLV